MNKRENQSNTHIRIWIPKVKEGKQKEEVKHEARIMITVNDEEMTWAKKGFTGFVRNVNHIHMPHDLMVDERTTSIKVIPLM